MIRADSTNIRSAPPIRPPNLSPVIVNDRSKSPSRTALILLLGGNGLVAWAEQYVASGVTALIIGVQPLFFVLTEWAWRGGIRPTMTTTLSLIVGFAGVAWLAAPWETVQAGGLHIPGVIANLSACEFWAFGSLYSRHAKHGADP